MSDTLIGRLRDVAWLTKENERLTAERDAAKADAKVLYDTLVKVTFACKEFAEEFGTKKQSKQMSQLLLALLERPR